MQNSRAKRSCRHQVSLLLGLLAISGCSTGKPSYVVFFHERSAQLDGPARDVVAAAAVQANRDPGAPVEVRGYTDSAGSPAADVTLSQQRAQVVADGLVAGGVSPQRLVRKGEGQTGEDPGLASRRVEIAVDSR